MDDSLGELIEENCRVLIPTLLNNLETQGFLSGSNNLDKAGKKSL